MNARWGMRTVGAAVMAAGLAASAAICATPGDAGKGGYPDLVMLFTEWRAFEAPPLREGAPDYTAATVARRHKELATYRARLGAFDTGGWSIEQKVDREILRAEMNGFDFNVRVLQPWARDPAFYATVWTEQSDTPAHEGPTPHGVVELWTYSFPLSPPAATKLADELAPIPAFLRQARVNLTGNARDLWITGIGTLRAQAKDLADLESKVAGAGTALRGRVSEARRATEDFVRWLDARAPSKTGPSGVGKDHYTWSLRNVHLVPMSWEEEVVLLQRELARAHTALRLEEERNRDLPQIVAVADEAEYQRRANLAVSKYIAFLRDRNLYPMRDSMDPALRERLGNFVPLESRNFFAIATHYEPLTLYTHFYHWWDLARIREEPHPSPIRRGALLYNIWDSRAEGMATAMEEFMLHAGLYDDTPRAREIVWIMLAQRAARGLASLYLQANEFDLKQAKEFQVRWTPRGWMREDLDLLGFEQQLYLRQPGYGTSYITGKYLLEDLLRERSRQLGDAFSMRRYFDEVNAAGLIPVSLIRWQLIGQDGAMRALARTAASP